MLLLEGVSQTAVGAFHQAGYSQVDCRQKSLTGAALHEAPAVSRAYPLPGPEVLSARDILQRTARLIGRNPRMYHIPLISPKLSSYWIRLVTRGDHHVTDELVEGLRTDILSPDAGFWKLFPEHRRQSFDDAVRSALREEAERLSLGAMLFEQVVDRVSPKRRGGSITP